MKIHLHALNAGYGFGAATSEFSHCCLAAKKENNMMIRKHEVMLYIRMAFCGGSDSHWFGRTIFGGIVPESCSMTILSSLYLLVLFHRKT